MKDNPTLQAGVLYEIVKLKEGYCVVPGTVAVLPSGLRVGRDFKLNGGISFKKLVSEGGSLNYRGVKMGVFLDFPIGDWRIGGEEPKNTLADKLNRLVEEFNEAMTFSMDEGDDAKLPGHKVSS